MVGPYVSPSCSERLSTYVHRFLWLFSSLSDSKRADCLMFDHFAILSYRQARMDNAVSMFMYKSRQWNNRFMFSTLDLPRYCLQWSARAVAIASHCTGANPCSVSRTVVLMFTRCVKIPSRESLGNIRWGFSRRVISRLRPPVHTVGGL